MLVKCTKYPELDVADIGVHFRAGSAEVDENQAEALRQMEGFGFEFEKSEDKSDLKSGEGGDIDSEEKPDQDKENEVEVKTPEKPKRGVKK